jgi:hypothetical protein
MLVDALSRAVVASCDGAIVPAVDQVWIMRCSDERIEHDVFVMASAMIALCALAQSGLLCHQVRGHWLRIRVDDGFEPTFSPSQDINSPLRLRQLGLEVKVPPKRAVWSFDTSTGCPRVVCEVGDSFVLGLTTWGRGLVQRTAPCMDSTASAAEVREPGVG